MNPARSRRQGRAGAPRQWPPGVGSPQTIPAWRWASAWLRLFVASDGLRPGQTPAFFFFASRRAG